MKMARTRALTQSGARFWTRALIREMKTTHAAPPTNITAASAPNLCNPLIARITTPKLTTPADTMDSIVHLSRAVCMTKAPIIAPPPKQPSKSPYAVAFRFTLRETVGSNAKRALEKNMATPVLSNTVRIAGECRTYRIAATAAPEKDSGGALLLRTGLFHLATTKMTPKNDAKFATKAVATPATDMIVPASAGPTARARLNSIPLRAEAAARSSLANNSGRIARHAGVSNASPAESANVSTRSIHGDITPAMVKIARINATPIIHDSVKRISLRRSTISPAEPAGRASRKNGKEAAVWVSAT